MSGFDEKIKQMAKSEQWDIPSNIDNKINNCLNSLEEKKPLRKRPLKVAVILFAIVVSTAATGLAVEQVINYFRYNENSAFVSSKNEIEKLGSNVNLSAKDKGIEFKVDSISADGNYINIFYTIKSDKKIKDIYPEYKKMVESAPYDRNDLFLNPTISVKANGEDLMEPHMIEHEAKLISDYELKGMRRVNAIHANLEKETNLKIYSQNIYGQEGNWVVESKVDLNKGLEETYNYKVNKDAVIKMTYRTYNKKNEDIEVEHKINIDEVRISPLGSQIILKEETKPIDDFSPMITNNFSIFDESGKCLDILDKGSSKFNLGPNISINSFEFLKATKETKSLSLVPFSTDYSRKLKVLDPKAVDKLPIVFKANDYGSVIVEEFKVTDKQINITFYKDGLVPYNTEFSFFDEKGKRVNMDHSLLSHSVNRHTGRYTATYDLGKTFKDASKIKKISIYENHIKLHDDQKIEIDLVKDNK